MGKKKKGSGNRAGSRTRVNPLTGQTETVAGPKAGKKRARTSFGDKLRTHDLRPEGARKAAHEALMKRNEKEDTKTSK